VRYRADRPLGELIENLQKELQNIDTDVKAKFGQYNAVRTNLATLQRRQTYVHTAEQGRLHVQCLQDNS